MSDKITIIKVLGHNDKVTMADLEKWRTRFAAGATVEEAIATGEVEAYTLPENNEKNQYITLVKVGGKEYSPTMEDLDNWRQVFEAAKGDPDFKIFTHSSIEIETINIGKIIAVE